MFNVVAQYFEKAFHWKKKILIAVAYTVLYLIISLFEVENLRCTALILVQSVTLHIFFRNKL